MKKILFVINTIGRAGAENALLELLRRIDKTKYRVSLLILTGQGELAGDIPEGVKVLNEKLIPVSVHSEEGRRYLRKTVIKALIKRLNILQLFPYFVSNGFRMLKAKQFRTEKLLWRAISDGAPRIESRYDLAISYIEGASAYYVADHVKADKKAAFIHVDYNEAGYTRKLDRNCYLNFDKIFGVSDEVIEVFRSVYPEMKDKTGVFHNLLNSEKIIKRSKEPGGFDDDFDGIRLLTVGRLMAQKAFEESIKACHILKQKGENIKWYVLGEGDQRKKLEALIDELNLKKDFILYGSVENPYPFISQADIYVHCSRFEGKSIAVQEAQILGKPIVVSDCSGNREQVVQNVDGIICEFDSKCIAEAIEGLIHDKAKRESIAEKASLKNDNEGENLNKLLEI